MPVLIIPETGHVSIISNYLEIKIIQHIFLATPTYEPPEVKYIALYDNAGGPSNYDTGHEIEGDSYNYKRVRVSASSTDSRFVISGSMAYNQEEYQWQCGTPSAWGEVYGWGIRDAETSGNLLFWGLFNTSIAKPTDNIRVSIAEEKMQISLSNQNQTNGGWTALAATKIINWLTNGSTVAPIPWNPSEGMKIALGRNIIFDAGNNLVSWTECSGDYTDYTRQTISASGWQMDLNGIVSNTEEIVFTEEAVGNWSTITDILLYDSTSASALFWGHLPATVTVVDGDKFKISVGAIQAACY